MTSAARPHAPERDAPVVLAYRALGLGDLLTGLPALRALSDAFPGHRRVLATPAWLAPLALHSGSVDTVVDCAPLQLLPESLASPEVAANLHGRGPESHRVVLAPRPRRTIAFACADIEATRRGPRWRADEHEVVRWCRLLQESGIPADPSRLDLAVQTSGSTPRSGTRPSFILVRARRRAGGRWDAGPRSPDARPPGGIRS